jgi:hypothetical protein
VVLGRLARRDLSGLPAVHPGRLLRVGHRGRLHPPPAVPAHHLAAADAGHHHQPGFATNTITQQIITNGVAQGRYGLASALSVLFTLSVAVLVVVQLLVSRRLERRLA